jgi:hypothetical protein
MPEPPPWKRALREPNAIAWIALFFVVVAVGFGSLYFGNHGPATQGTQHAAK